MQDVDIIYDHYKETFNLSKESQNKRNKCFVILCFLEAISFLMTVHSEVATYILLNIINEVTDMELVFGKSILQSLLWVLVAYILIRYVQLNIYIERQYEYISRLEDGITSALKGVKIDRESGSYLKNYPAILNIIDCLYKWFFPLLFLSINIVRIIIEWKELGICLAVICDSLICFVILLISSFYLLAIHNKSYQKLKSFFRRKKNG